MTFGDEELHRSLIADFEEAGAASAQCAAAAGAQIESMTAEAVTAPVAATVEILGDCLAPAAGDTTPGEQRDSGCPTE
jgi:hypothetical protein